jgi:iron complex transport system permease protein
VTAAVRAPAFGLYAWLGLAVAALLALSFLVGPSRVAWPRLILGLFGDGDAAIGLVAREIRLPRAVLGALVGSVLGLSGAVLQGYLRNPLAEPGLIGTSATAALGAVIVLYFGLSEAFPLALPLGGMTGAAVGVVLLYAVAGRTVGALTLILAGIMIASLAGSLTALALNLAPNPHAALEIAFWLLGSLADRSLDHVSLAGPFMLAGGAVLLTVGRGLDAISLGERTAQSLGIALGALQARIVLGVAAAVGAAVAVTGAIGFVGLVVPHLLRPWVGAEPSRLLPASALGGAALLLAADIAIRLLPLDAELKLGVVTGLLGAPFFLALLIVRRRSLL